MNKSGYKAIVRKTMLLLLAASFALYPNFAFAANAADAADSDAVAILSRAAGLPEKNIKKTARDLAAEGDKLVQTAAYAASLIRYRRGYQSTLPDDSGALPAPTAQETEEAIGRLLEETLAFDSAPYMEQLRGKQLKLYKTYAENASVFMEMAETVRVRTERAVQLCVPIVRRDLAAAGVSMRQPPAPYNLPNWKSLAALTYAYGKDALPMLRASLRVRLDTSEEGATFALSYGTYDEIAAQGKRNPFILARFAYAYLNTVFDDAGAAVITEKRVYDDAYLKTVMHPVPGYLVKNGWFDPRDRGTRVHTGTDIRAPGGTRILSATDGEVLYIGYLPIPGWYVIVRDPSGYEYHYYHMRERTTFVREGDAVSQGDVLGRVGNTGNSAANHLHLTVVSPEYAYVNPYDLLKQAGVTPIREDG